MQGFTGAPLVTHISRTSALKERGETRAAEGGWWCQCQGKALFNPQEPPFWKWFPSNCQHLVFFIDKH